MSEILEMANRCIHEQGYFVVGSFRELARQQVIDGVINLEGYPLDHKLCVLRQTDYADYCLTAKIAGREEPPPHHEGARYYRVTAE